jgi:trehalose 6-phosphate phosphatase
MVQVIDPHIEEAAQTAASVLRHRPSGLFSDFDGTLSEIAPTPEDAVFHAGAHDALVRAANQVDVTGIITGRAVNDVLERVEMPELLIVGNHGLEWFERGERVDHEAGTAAIAGITQALDATRRRLEPLVSTDGMIFENKRLSASIHFRNSPDPVDVGTHLMPIIEEEARAHDLRVSGGKMLVELRPNATVSKGTALEQVVRRRQLRGAVFIGDDVTDVDGFRALHRLREAGGIATAAIAIRSADVHPDVIAEADVVLEGVADTVVLLNRIAALLSGNEGSKV